MLDNSLKPRLSLKYPPPQPPASLPPPEAFRKIEESSPAPEPTPPSPAPKAEKKAKKEKFQLTYLHRDGRPWAPKRMKPSQIRYRAKKKAARKEGWIDIVCGLFCAEGEGREAFAALRRDIVRGAFDRRLVKADAVAELQALWMKAQESAES